MKVPLLDLAAQHEPLWGELERALKVVFSHRKFIMGEEVGQLEHSIAKLTGTKHAVACASGSDALLLSLMALGVGPGDGVITSPHTFFATAGVVARLGATPVFVDIDPLTYTLSLDHLEEALARQEKVSVKAIIPVHLFGQMVNMEKIMDVANRYRCFVVEDAAQAIGASYRGKPAGSLGHCGCFSFFPSKNLGCMGDGGMVVTNDDHLAESLRLLRVHGAKPKYHHHVVGCNSRLDTLQAAILNVKLPWLERWSAARRSNASWYDNAFQKRNIQGREVITPFVDCHGIHVFNQYVIRARDRDRLVQHLHERGVGNEIYYPIPLHLQECFRSLGYRAGDFPVAEMAAQETLALPIYPELTLEQREYVVESVVDFYQ